jgi:two-component system, OmpR family, phosphate regulon sensor histidine kinase PhoR
MPIADENKRKTTLVEICLQLSLLTGSVFTVLIFTRFSELHPMLIFAGLAFLLNLTALILVRRGVCRDSAKNYHTSDRAAQSLQFMLSKSGESNTYLQNIIQSMADSLIVVDPDGHIELVNQATLEMLGYEASELIGKPISAVFANLSPHKNGIDTLLEKLFVRRVEKTYLTKSRREIPVLFSGAVMREDDHKVRAVCVAQDISERKHAEQQRLALALEREKVIILSNFIRDASHDLRTPLAIINTNLYLMEKLFPETGHRHIQAIQHQTNRLSHIVESMITLVRLDNTLHFRFEQVNLNRVVREVCTRVDTAAKSKNITVSLNLDENLPQIQADEIELNQALVNIVQNAIQFSQSEKSVRVFTYKLDNFAIVEVLDTGIGISKDDLPHIFERFYRADPARATTTGGAGLGLSVARRIIEVHQGKIEVNSIPQKGSLFRVHLPMLSQEAFDRGN